MRRPHLLVLLAACAACEAEPAPTPSAFTLPEASAALATERASLSASTEPIAQFTGYLTQVIPGVAAPISEMKAHCPEKILRADKRLMYGLEAPYPVKRLLLAEGGLAGVPIKDYTTAATSPYGGDYVLVSSGDALLSVFPEGVANTTDAKGNPVPAAKLLRTVRARIDRGGWGHTDDNGRSWTGSQLVASAQFPGGATTAATEALQQWKEAPCQ